MKTLQYSQWKKINLRPKKTRLKKKFDSLYAENHPRYKEYCFHRFNRAMQGRFTPSVAAYGALLSGAYTDVALERALREIEKHGNPFLKLMSKSPDSWKSIEISIPN